MSQTKPPRDSSPPRNVLPDLLIPVLALAFTAYYMTTITDVPWTSQASAVTVGSLLTIAILAYFVRTFLRVRRGIEVVSLPGNRLVAPATVRRAVLLVLTIGYVLVCEYLGFTLTTALFVFLGIVTLSSLRNWKRAATVALICSVSGYIVFIYFFGTRFPRGPVENFLNGLS